MAILQRISRFLGSDLGVQAQEALHQAYQETSARAALLHTHADLAPQEASQTALQALAEKEDLQVANLRERLRATESVLPKTVPPTPLKAQSHWARLVADLEFQREAARRYRELAIRFAGAVPASRDLFHQLSRNCETQCLVLRALIARADPQAAD